MPRIRRDKFSVFNLLGLPPSEEEEARMRQEEEERLRQQEQALEARKQKKSEIPYLYIVQWKFHILLLSFNPSCVKSWYNVSGCNDLFLSSLKVFSDHGCLI